MNEHINVLIVESCRDLAEIWRCHLERLGARVCLAQGQDAAIALLQDRDFHIIVQDLVIEEGSALAVADYANYRQPDCRVIFVTNTTFFSDGSIFRHCANACAFLPCATAPDDLAAMVDHYAHRAA